MQQFQFCDCFKMFREVEMKSQQAPCWCTKKNDLTKKVQVIPICPCIRSKHVIALKANVMTRIYNHLNGKWKQHEEGSIWFDLPWVLWTSALLLSLLSSMHPLRLPSVIYGLFSMQQWLQIEITLNKWTLQIWQQHFPKVGAKPLLCPWFISTPSLAKLCSSLNNYILSTSNDFRWVAWWLITLGKEYLGC